MQDNIFYTPSINPDAEYFILPEEESKHCIKVLRLLEGEYITLVDGCGNAYECIIVTPNAKHCEVQITDIEREVQKKNYKLHIALAPTKLNERTEWFLEKCTEIGIDEITPLLCHRSERKELKTERMMKIIIAAMKQSHKAYLPRLNEMTPLKRVIEEATETQRYICHCGDGEKVPLKTASPHSDTLILIGPEGDFDKEELELAKQRGFIPTTLGESRLRTETAGIVACHTIHLINS
ncbi:MAG: 16S rRNA (uracil(1498)-N(3))-methyltransferase [Paludibacteraceae bacterium]|nr:16S rRNA (uracil(1498)-N(3))-methyltransferase [Paludibacteraceae bacterium]